MLAPTDAPATPPVVEPVVEELAAPLRWCVDDVGRRNWADARVQWMSGKRTGYGVVAWRVGLAALAAEHAPHGATFAAVAADGAARFADAYLAAAPRRVLAAQWARDVGHAAETALSCVAAALGAEGETLDAAYAAVFDDDGGAVRAPDDGPAALVDATRRLCSALALFSAPAATLAAALNADAGAPADGDAGWAHGRVALAHADPRRAIVDVDRARTVPWARLLRGAGCVDRGATAALVEARPELVDDDFPPLDDAQAAAAGVLRAFLIHRRVSFTRDDDDG
jgi:hypothetical protein